MIRVLLFGDTHLGFDFPARPRVERHRRGDDFFANAERALDRALEGDVDLVVHGGDVFYRSRIPSGLAERGYRLLRRVADAGVPVFVVPGNHERSQLPYPLLARHPRIFVFDRPRSFALTLRGQRVVLGGFPFERAGARAAFLALVDRTGLLAESADVRLLCMHEAVEGARVGPSDFTFRARPDVVRARELPDTIAAVLSGHIHRHQVLTADLRGHALVAPVFYPGSVERTSLAERDETKGYVLLDLQESRQGGRVTGWRFVELPTRPMACAERYAVRERGDHGAAASAGAMMRACGGQPRRQRNAAPARGAGAACALRVGRV